MCISVVQAFHFQFLSQVEIERAHDVEEIFDAVSYQKGSAVIRMLQNYMGFDVSSLNAPVFLNPPFACFLKCLTPVSF